MRGRPLDLEQKFLPDGLSRVSELTFLDAAERRFVSSPPSSRLRPDQSCLSAPIGSTRPARSTGTSAANTQAATTHSKPPA